MSRLILAALAATLLVASSVSGFAAQGASKYAPGQIYNKKQHQSLNGHPGASGYAPGQCITNEVPKACQGLLVTHQAIRSTEKTDESGGGFYHTAASHRQAF
jgi:hypothetical protein